MASLSRSPTVSLTIRKKAKKTAKYYDPINRVGNTIIARIGPNDRLGNLYEGDTLVINRDDDPTGHINMTYHIVELPADGTAAFEMLSRLSYFGSLQKEHPKLTENIRNNPTQNKENIGVMKTSFVLTDVHEKAIDESISVDDMMYAIPEKAPSEYGTLSNAHRFTIGSAKTFKAVLGDKDGFKLTDDQVNILLPKFAVGRAHNGKKAGYGNCFYTVRY